MWYFDFYIIIAQIIFANYARVNILGWQLRGKKNANESRVKSVIKVIKKSQLFIKNTRYKLDTTGNEHEIPNTTMGM